MAQRDLFLRNATLYENEEAAITDLNALDHAVGQPVVVRGATVMVARILHFLLLRETH